jgi:uncharacterized protein
MSTSRNGIADRKPLVAASCPECPWGAIADVLKLMLKPTGYDLQICYTCSRANNPRIVYGDVAPPKTDRQGSPPPPDGMPDFGITSAYRLQWAYNGTFEYAEEGPRPKLRLITFIETPSYVMVAANAASGISDMRQIAKEKRPLKVITPNNESTKPILDYYGMSKGAVEAWGGMFMPIQPGTPKEFDVIVYSQVMMCNIPETRGFNELSIKHDMVYFDLPEDLRDRLVSNLGFMKVNMPRAYFRGLKRPIATCGRSGTAIYCLEDTPEDFAYIVAKAMNERRSDLQWLHLQVSIDPETVAQLPGVPLHHGARRYYEEVGYL